MKRTLLTLSILASCMSGCKATDFTNGNGPLTLRLTGIVIKDTSLSPPYKLIDLKEITPTGDAVADLDVNRTHASKEILKVEIRQTCAGVDHIYSAVIIPRMGEAVSWSVSTASQGVEMESPGTLFIWGHMPRAWTPMVAAGSIGSTLAFQVTDTSKRVYFANHEMAFTECEPTTGDPIRRETLREWENKYFTFPDDCTGTSDPKEIGSDPDFALAKEIAGAAGWSTGM